MQEFEEIYRLYFYKVYGFLMKLSGNFHTADELTQETFLKAIISIDKFRGECEISTWLCRIARNEYLNYISKRDNKNSSVEFESELYSSEDIENECVDREYAMNIRKVLHVLDEPYKEVFTLRTMGELKFSEIGEIFGKSEVWARVTYFRAKEKIIVKLEGEK